MADKKQTIFALVPHYYINRAAPEIKFFCFVFYFSLLNPSTSAQNTHKKSTFSQKKKKLRQKKEEGFTSHPDPGCTSQLSLSDKHGI